MQLLQNVTFNADTNVMIDIIKYPDPKTMLDRDATAHKTKKRHIKAKS